ncbi:MAG TPA: hemolysin III family protein [Blastocatellia bacterium]|jgi:hemolysin III|nr:hemolysin III family protein [Blastocatellia bacterium]
MSITSNIEAPGLVVEELANSITHGIGLALSVVGFGILLTLAIVNGTAWHIVGCSVFGLSLIALYSASTVYHSLRSPRIRHVFKVLDHAAIYLLIAGTYTPFTLVNLRGFWGWTLLALVWSLAVSGIVFKVFFVERFVIASTLVYILMGWSCVIAVKPLLTLVPMGGIFWLLGGGIAYTVGTIFFAWKRLPYNHAIWHLFVVAGSICHYFAVVFYVLPSKV